MDIIENHQKVVLVAILCLMVIEVTALIKGINGNLFATVAFIIGGLAGWTAPSWMRKRKSRR